MALDIFFIIFGLFFGSFYAALSYRLPRDISISKGRSMCPKCKNTIAWYDNVPLLSFVFLLGKCRHCKKSISPRYFLIELTTAIGFFFIGSLGYGIIHTLFLLIIFSILVLIFVIDAEHQIIPDSLVFTGIFVTFVKLVIVDNQGIFIGFLAGLFAATFLLIVHLLTKGRGMGLGDVKFAILGGLLMGPKLTPVWLFLAFLTGAIVGIILILGRRAGLKDKIAFGPFLIVGLVATYVWGSNIYRFIFF